MTDRELIKGCLANNRSAQRRLYSKYAGEMLKVCQYYTGSQVDAEDVFQEGFINFFNNIHRYDDEYPLRPWMQKIFINAALKFHRTNKKEKFKIDIDQVFEETRMNDQHLQILSNLSYEELLLWVQRLPDGYRMVFSMYVIEGYKHDEIAKSLNISVGTSKSQLLRAKKYLKNLLEKTLEPSLILETANGRQAII